MWDVKKSEIGERRKRWGVCRGGDRESQGVGTDEAGR